MVSVSWRANGEDTMRVRELLLILLEVLECEGWTVYASVDQKNGGENFTETDTVSISYSSFQYLCVLTCCSGTVVSRKGGQVVRQFITIERRDEWEL
jgi:hypothetical protein